MQVNDLISSFRPIPAAPTASVSLSLTDDARPHAFSSPVLAEKLRPAPRQSSPRNLYLSEVRHTHSLAVHDPQAPQVAPRQLYVLYETETRRASTQPTIEPRYGVQHPAYLRQGGSYYADVYQRPADHQSGSVYADIYQPASHHHSGLDYDRLHHQSALHPDGLHYANVHQPSSHHRSDLYYANVHQPYLPEKPFLTSEDALRRYISRNFKTICCISVHKK